MTRHLRPAALLAALLVAPGCGDGGNDAAGPVNFVFVLADDLGWMDVGYNGSTFYETPHIDALAEKGVVFARAYAASPVCSPTRASILTGIHPARLGLTGAIVAGQRWSMTERPYLDEVTVGERQYSQRPSRVET